MRLPGSRGTQPRLSARCAGRQTLAVIMTSTCPTLTGTRTAERHPRDLCDTGPLVAAFNEADSDHARCSAFLASNWSRLVIPSLAVTEVCHLLADPQRRGRVGLAAEFCAAIADDELRVIEMIIACRAGCFHTHIRSAEPCRAWPGKPAGSLIARRRLA